jgi:hypothetical protein
VVGEKVAVKRVESPGGRGWVVREVAWVSLVGMGVVRVGKVRAEHT